MGSAITSSEDVIKAGQVVGTAKYVPGVGKVIALGVAAGYAGYAGYTAYKSARKAISDCAKK